MKIRTKKQLKSIEYFSKIAEIFSTAQVFFV